MALFLLMKIRGLTANIEKYTMNKKNLLLVFIFWSFTLIGFAQEEVISIEGRIVNADTQEAVAFANVGIEGTSKGVASDVNGFFELKISYKYATHLLKVSAIGFFPYEIKLYEAKAKKNFTVNLKSVTYSLKSVNVYGESLVYRKLLRNAVESIGRNYLQSPLSYTGYFKYSYSKAGMEEWKKESIVDIYDSEGYIRTDPAHTFNALNYAFSQVKKSREPLSTIEGMTFFDDVLTCDIVRHTRNILDLEQSDRFILKNGGRFIYEGDSVQKIVYKSISPDINVFGDADPVSYEGEIYINLKDKAVLKNILKTKLSSSSTLGKSFMPLRDDPSDLDVKIVTNYVKVNNRYFLKGISMVYDYRTSEGEITENFQYITERLNYTRPKVVKGRIYYESMSGNATLGHSYFKGESSSGD